MPNPTTAYDPDAAPWAQVLTADQTTAALQDGWDVLEGRVLATAGILGLKPDEIRDKVGAPQRERPFVDLVTVVPHRWMTIEDQHVARTRFPTGSCLVRVDPDGSRRLLTYFDGPAYGWRNGRGFADPAATRPRATYRGMDCAAAPVPGDDDAIELVVSADEPPPGFDWSRPGVCRAIVPIADVDDLR